MLELVVNFPHQHGTIITYVMRNDFYKQVAQALAHDHYCHCIAWASPLTSDVREREVYGLC